MKNELMLLTTSVNKQKDVNTNFKTIVFFLIIAIIIMLIIKVFLKYLKVDKKSNKFKRVKRVINEIDTYFLLSTSIFLGLFLIWASLIYYEFIAKQLLEQKFIFIIVIILMLFGKFLFGDNNKAESDILTETNYKEIDISLNILIVIGGYLYLLKGNNQIFNFIILFVTSVLVITKISFSIDALNLKKIKEIKDE